VGSIEPNGLATGRFAIHSLPGRRKSATYWHWIKIHYVRVFVRRRINAGRKWSECCIYYVKLIIFVTANAVKATFIKNDYQHRIVFPIANGQDEYVCKLLDEKM